MSFETERFLEGVHRTIGTVERDGETMKRLTVALELPHEPEEVWDALTDPKRVERWFLPVSGDLRPGGRYQLEGNASGEILECEAPRLLALTWEFMGGTSWVTVRLSKAPAGTAVEFENVAAVPAELWDQWGPGAVGIGWDMGFLGLARHLGDAERYPVPPEKDEAWMASPEAAHFYRTSSDAWCRASIAHGTPEAQALAAAERSHAAFSGQGDA